MNGNAIDRAAIQIGIKGNSLRELLDIGICRIEDLTPLVRKWNMQRKNGRLGAKELPSEKLYPIMDGEVRKRLAMER